MELSSFRTAKATTAAAIRRTLKKRLYQGATRDFEDIKNLNKEFAEIDRLIPTLNKGDRAYHQREELRAMVEEMRYEYELTISSYYDDDVRKIKAEALIKEVQELNKNLITPFYAKKGSSGYPGIADQQKALDDYINKDWSAFAKLWGFKLLRLTLQVAAAAAIAFAGAALVAHFLPTAAANQAFHAAQTLMEKVFIALNSTQLFGGALTLAGTAIVANIYAGKPYHGTHGVVIKHGVEEIIPKSPSSPHPMASAAATVPAGMHAGSGGVGGAAFPEYKDGDPKVESEPQKPGWPVPVIGPAVRLTDKWVFNFFTPYNQLIAERAKAELDAIAPRKYVYFGPRSK